VTRRAGSTPDQVLNSGRVIPGYGHAVLRKTDPRFTCQALFLSLSLSLSLSTHSSCGQLLPARDSAPCLSENISLSLSLHPPHSLPASLILLPASPRARALHVPGATWHVRRVAQRLDPPWDEDPWSRCFVG